MIRPLFNIILNMDTSKLKLYVGMVLKLQTKYGWLVDCYVLDFFTDNLWDKLPGKWSDVLAELQPEEIAYFFLEMYSSLKQRQSQKPKFRKVWPLELLAFIASCRLNLNNLTWTHKFDATQNTKRKHAVQENVQTKLTKTIDCKTNISNNDRNIQEDLKQADTQVLHTDNEQTLQHHNLSHLFQCHVKPKKRYEIDVLSKVICEQAEKLQCWNIVDVGAGLGHLSRLLSYGYQLRVVTIEGDGCHQSGAEKIDRKVFSHLKKEAGIAGSSLVHVTHHINANISAAEFSNVVLEAFSKMEDEPHSQYPRNLQTWPKSAERFLIVGLHTCGDLAPTLLRVFSQCDNAVGIVSVACCYMKLNHEIAKTDQGTVTQKMTKLDTIPTKLYSTKMCGNVQQNNVKLTNPTSRPNPATDICDQQQSCTKLTNSIRQNDLELKDYTSRQNPVERCLPNSQQNSMESTSFNRRNDLGFADSTRIHFGTEICRNFGQGEIKNDSLYSRQPLTTQCDELKVAELDSISTVEAVKILGYPLSNYVKSLSGHRQTYNALESACHAIEGYHKKLLEISPTLKLHYYRALLEFLLKQKDPGCPRRQIRTLRTKKAASMTFTEYVTSACDILSIEESRPTSQDIQVAEEIHAGKQFNVVVFYVLRLLMAPVIEGLLLVDRLIYVREKHPDINARISMLFDPDISPRNFAIIAEKS